MTVFGFFLLLLSSQNCFIFTIWLHIVGSYKAPRKETVVNSSTWKSVCLINSLHLRSFWSSGLCADALFTYGQGLRTNYKADRTGEGSDLTAWRCALCNRLLWARKRSLVNRSNNRLEKIWSQKYFKKCFKVIHFNCAMETLLARLLLPHRQPDFLPCQEVRSKPE